MEQNVREALGKLLERYEQNKGDASFSSNEKQACQSLIVPLIRDVLHWNTEDPSEFKAEESKGGKRIDYVVYHQGISQFIIEAKAPIKEIFDNIDFYKQVLEYGRSKNHDFAILTNFRQVVILACRIAFRVVGETEIARLNLLEEKDEDLQQLLCFERQSWLSSGSNNLLYTKLGKHKKNIPVDEELLEDMKHWREMLLTNIRSKSQNKFDFDDEQEFMHIEEQIQKFIDRLIFICYAEDKELEEPLLIGLLHDKQERFNLKPGFLLLKMWEQFERYRRIYDSDLFDSSDCDRFMVDDDKLMKVLEDLREPKGRIAYNFRSMEADILGKAYENFIGHLSTGKKRFKEKEDIGKRKKGGIYYTPRYIVDYIVNNTVREYVKGKTFVEMSKVKILDPACGSGSFLLRVFDVLVEEGAKQLKRQLTYEEKKHLMLGCIHGVDVDERAVAIAKLNLSLKMAERGQPLPMLNENIRLGNSLIDDEAIAGYKAFVWEEEFKEIMQEGGFDVVVGNPPWVSIKGKQKSVDLSDKELNYLLQKYPCDTYRPNLFEMFVWRALSLVKKEGFFSFIVPDRLCCNGQFINLRKHILDNFKLQKLWFKPLFEGIISDTVIFILNKEKATLKSYVEIAEYPSIIFKKILQQFYQKIADNSWSIVDEKVFRIFDELRNKIEVIELSHEFQTKVGFIAKPDQLTKIRKNNKQIRVYKGENIQRFGIRDNYYFEFKKENLAGGTQDILKLSKKNKVFLRKTGINIIATFDNSGTYPEQSVYFVYTENDSDQAALKYLCALLNSKLLNCYYRHFAITNRDATPQLKKIDLDHFPIILPKNKDQFVLNVDKMLSLRNQLQALGDRRTDERVKIESEIKKTDQEIDELVYKLYGLTNEEVKIVEESLK